MEYEHDRPPPTALVIFGVAGDLTRRKLVPALFNLYLDKVLPEAFALIGLDRVEMSDDQLRDRLHEGTAEFCGRGTVDKEAWAAFAARIQYRHADFTQLAHYQELARRLEELDALWHAKANRIFYLAVPPMLFGPIARLVGEAGLSGNRQRARIVVEKPVGYDLESSQQLDATLLEKFREPQIFRIDHYLGKETVQNILAFRFASALFEPIWDRRYVDHITITVAEQVGVEHRGGYYDRAGALRDMVQNHLMQLFCLVAMEAPVSFNAEEIRNRKSDVLHAVRPIAHRDVHSLAARGQYGPGWVRGHHVPGYRDEPGIGPDSSTETFAAIKLFVDNWRWQGVPFYLRTGKRLRRTVSEISIRFRAAPHQPFPPEATLDWQPARLVICIQPKEGVVLRFQAKQPGRQMHLRPVDMRFSYRDVFAKPSPDAYETLLWDIMTDDTTLFMRADQVEAAWAILTPVLDVWGATPPSDFPNYDAGTWGPESAEILVARDGRSWLEPSCACDE
ncbi:MAG: glucose-6-phosphate dehydrogenase [Thermoguttaceae bacterium]